MRMIGTSANGIRLPIIAKGDNLGEIVVDSLMQAMKEEGFEIRDRDVIGITEAVVAKSQDNYATIDDIANDIRSKFPDGEVGVVFPILSRNRFLNILKGISKGAKKVYLLLNYPSDEVGNPIIDISKVDPDDIERKLYSEDEFKHIVNDFVHPFTGMDYVSLYKSAGDNIEVYFSRDARDILKLTKNVLDAEIHARFRTKQRLLKAGAETVHMLSDVLSTPQEGRGHNSEFGVLGSNMSTETVLKLFPNDCSDLVQFIKKEIKVETGKDVEVLVYGDGAFKDPACGIWELADPVVSPAFTTGLEGKPSEIKLKYIVDNNFSGMNTDDTKKAVHNFIRSKDTTLEANKEGTTPRNYADLLGSLCDLVSGSGDKGTPVVHIQGYFDDYTIE